MTPESRSGELIDRLAAEYVLGTLRGGARWRFERWRSTSSHVDERCRFWEERLMPLHSGLRPIAPPRYVWERIRDRLELAPSPPRAFARRHAWAVAASIALVVGLALSSYWRVVGFERTSEVATLADPAGATLWSVEIYANRQGTVGYRVRSGARAHPPPGRDYELWALPKGAAPVSLGVLPYDSRVARHAVSSAQKAALLTAAQVAVSIEPPGGSPTGQPTGAVVYAASLDATSG